MTPERRTILRAGIGAFAGHAFSALSVGQTSDSGKNMMKVQDVFALITTDKMAECRDFYVNYFGFTVSFESTIYLQLSVPSEEGHGFSLAFMPSNHPFGVVGPDVFNGHGLMLTIQVADTAALYKQMIEKKAPVIHALKDEAWGQRRFTLRDPAGVAVDVVQPIEPAPGYYDKYKVKGAPGPAGAE